MTQKKLNCSKVSTMINQMGGKGMLKSFMQQISGKTDGVAPSLPDAQLLQKQLGSKIPTNLTGFNFKK